MSPRETPTAVSVVAPSAGRAVHLRCADLSATLRGGELLTIASLRHRGDELLAVPESLPAAYLIHGRRAGITLMHPWANRLGADRFTVACAEVVLDDDPALARDGAGLALHGRAVPGTWRPSATGTATARARAVFAAVPAFPWRHEVEVEVVLAAPARLEVTTTVRGAGTPIAFGWHPYFAPPGPPRADWRLALPARDRLELDARGLPTGATLSEGPEDAPLAARAFDDGYEGLYPGAEFVLDAGRRVTVELVAGYPAAQVFAPADAGIVSLEPMTAPTDALRTGRGLRAAGPGAPFQARFAVTVG